MRTRICERTVSPVSCQPDCHGGQRSDQQFPRAENEIDMLSHAKIKFESKFLQEEKKGKKKWLILIPRLKDIAYTTFYLKNSFHSFRIDSFLIFKLIGAYL